MSLYSAGRLASVPYSRRGTPLNYPDFQALIQRCAAFASVREYGRVSEAGRTYSLWCIETPGARQVVVTAGFHGEEPAGPLTLAYRLEEAAEYARARGVGLRVYPCINPSGFERGQRYNASGERPNNDFLRYRGADGELLEEVGVGVPFASWETWEGGPKETRVLREDLVRSRLPDAALDLHQDAWVQRPCFYAYFFTERERHVELVRRCTRWAKVGINVAVHDASRTDRAGLIIHHDGSISDWFHRRGVRHVAVLETSTKLPQDTCDWVNLEWIRSYVDLASEAPPRVR